MLDKSKTYMLYLLSAVALLVTAQLVTLGIESYQLRNVSDTSFCGGIDGCTYVRVDAKGNRFGFPIPSVTIHATQPNSFPDQAQYELGLRQKVGDKLMGEAGFPTSALLASSDQFAVVLDKATSDQSHAFAQHKKHKGHK